MTPKIHKKLTTNHLTAQLNVYMVSSLSIIQKIVYYPIHVVRMYSNDVCYRKFQVVSSFRILTSQFDKDEMATSYINCASGEKKNK